MQPDWPIANATAVTLARRRRSRHQLPIASVESSLRTVLHQQV